MADNVTLDTMSGGDSVAADDIGSVKYQRIKLTIGADGVNDGDVASGNPLPVSLASVPSHAVTNAGTFAVQIDGSALTSLQLIDDAVSGAGFNITQLGGAAIPMITTQADDVANTTDGLVVTSFNMVYDGTTWDRARGSSANGMQVDLVNTQANSTAIKVNVASGGIASGAIASGAIASGAIASGAIAAGAIAAGATSIATTEDSASAAADHLVKIASERLDTPVANANVSNDGDYLQVLSDNFGKIWVSGTVPEDVAHIAGESIQRGGVRRIDTAATSAGSSGDWATMDASAEGALWATLTPTTTSGLSTFMASGSDGSSILVATAQAVKASTGNLYGYYLYNPESAATFVHFYNTAAASVTVGTTNPLFTVVVPATSAANLAFPYPVNFSNAGWSIAATTTAGGNTAPATGVSAVIWYK